MQRSFLNNPGLNGLIIGVLVLGIIYAFRQVMRLYPEIRWVNACRIASGESHSGLRRPRDCRVCS